MRRCARLPWRAGGLALALLLPTTILGCSPSASAPEAVQPALGRIAVDAAPHRCPEIDARVERALAERFPAPPASHQRADGRMGIDDDDVRLWLDRAEALDGRKTAAGVSLIRSYKDCRAGSDRVVIGGG